MPPTPPHPTEQAFLDDIVAHPDDPSLWLILADWLEDQGDPRAELVRLTQQLLREPRHRQFKTRQARLQELLAGGLVPVVPRLLLDGFAFAWIPAGTFFMGSPTAEKSHSTNEKRHEVTLTRGFWMGIYPVTQGQWQSVMGSNPSHFARNGAGKEQVKEVADADLERFPVESVSWDMAQEFCDKLSARLGRRISLPSEAQWEYACRAGTKTPYHFGPGLNGTEANCNGTYPFGISEKGPYLERPTPVGLEAYPANAWGLSDMHGNVWEWCQDAYRGDYEKLPASDQLFEQENAQSRVLRGGSWLNDAWFCRAAFRIRYAPAFVDDNVGLRVCCCLD